MPNHVDDDLHAVALGMIVLMIIYLLIKFRVRWAAVVAPSVDDDRPAAVAADRGRDLVGWNTDEPGEWKRGTQKVTCKPYRCGSTYTSLLSPLGDLDEQVTTKKNLVTPRNI